MKNSKNKKQNKSHNDYNPLISLIVPIYNVEIFLKECIDSILNQTYKNIELILVDDESPDNSGKICEDYKEKDSRVVVIHQKNQGVAGARNTGIKASKGEYICFVDSDDYVHPEYVERLYSIIKKYNAEFSFCKYYCVDENSNIIEQKNDKKSHEDLKDVSYNKFDYLNILNSHQTTNMVWNNMYKRSIFDNIQFPVGKRWEDCRVIYKIVDCFDVIHGINEKLYYYRTHSSSFVNKHITLEHLSFFEMLREKIDYYNEKDYKSCYITTVKIYFYNIIYYACNLYSDKPIDKELISVLMEYYNYIRQVIDKNKRDYSIGFKIKYFFFKCSPYLYSKARVLAIRILLNRNYLRK